MATRKDISVVVLLSATLIIFPLRTLLAQSSNLSIGTEQVKDKAVLWLKGNGTNQGLLLPAVTNRSSFTGLNNSDDKGMLIYDLSDNKIYLWNGSAWIEASGSSGTTYTGGTGIQIVGTVINNAGDTDATNDITSTTAAGGDLTGTYPDPTIKGGAVTSAKLAANAVATTNITNLAVDDSKISNVAPAKITQSGAATGQVLKWSGSAWTPQNDNAGGGVTNIITGTGLTGGPITATGTIAIAAGGITATQLAASAVTNNAIAANAVNSSQIINGTIDNTDISATAAIAVSKLAPGTNLQVLTVNAGVASWQSPGGATGTAGGDLSGSYPNPTIGSTAATGGNIITAVNAASTLINGARVNPSFGAQNISTTGTATTGGGINVGGSNQFIVNATGNITKINNITTSFPGTQGASNSYLTNNGAGVLSWTTPGSSFSTANVIPKGDGVSALTSSSLFDDGTNVGVGTASPAYKLDVTGNVVNTNITNGDLGLTGDLPGYGAATYPTLKTSGGYLYFSAGGKYSAYLGGAADAEFGINNTAASPTILLRSNGNTYFTGGYVGFGMATPAYQVDVSGGYAMRVTGSSTALSVFSPTYAVESTSSGGFGYGTKGLNTSSFGVGAGGEHNGNGYGVFGVNGGGGYAGYFSGPVYTSGSYQSSDEKLKDNIKDFTQNSVELLQKISIKSYNYRDTGEFESMNLPEGEQVGLLAGDLEKIFPQLIKESLHLKPDTTKRGPGTESNKLNPEINDTSARLIPFKAVNYTGLIPYLIKAVQEQQDSISTLKERIKVLEDKTRNIDQVFSQLNELRKEIETQKSILGMQAKRDEN